MQLKIAHKIAILMAITTFGLTILVVATLSSLGAVSSHTERLATHEDPLQLKALALKFNVVQVQQWLTDISATRGLDGLNDGFEKAEEFAQKAQALIAELASLDPDNRSAYLDLGPALDDYYATGKRMALAYVEQGPSGGNRIMEAFDETAETLTAKVDTLVAEAQDRKNAALAVQRQAADAARVWISGISIILSVLMLGGMGLLLQALRPLQVLKDVALKIADGDLGVPVASLTAQDEVGELGRAVERMRSTLVASMSAISDTSAEIHLAIGVVGQASEQTRAGTLQQQSENEQVAAAINEMSAAVQEVARSAAHAAEAANEAAQQVGSGTVVVGQTIKAIAQLADEISSASAVVIELSQQADSIGSVLDVIRGIAEQTNLLALNAAIEAARAGEHGRGFAVVADEVRTLASRTQESTHEIRTMIEKLQSRARASAEAMERSGHQGRLAVDQAGETGRSLQAIKTAVDAIQGASGQIASATEEQSSVANEIHRSIVNISEVLGQTAQAAEQTAASIDSLGETADGLKSLTARFRT